MCAVRLLFGDRGSATRSQREIRAIISIIIMKKKKFSYFYYYVLLSTNDGRVFIANASVITPQRNRAFLLRDQSYET